MTLRNGKVLLPGTSPGEPAMLEKGPARSHDGQLQPVTIALVELPSDLTYLVGFHMPMAMGWKDSC